jgi:hypothetical protein
MRSFAPTAPALTRAACGLLLAAAFALSPAVAGKVVGPTDCTNCHDHEAATKAWHNHAHFKSLDIFEGQKAKNFLTKMGIKDPYSDFCTSCHATVVDGEPNFGVSCESCHGGASDFIKPHQQKGSYEKAISLGMLRTKDLAVRAKNCAGCHIVREKKLLDAGHPNGAGFDIVEGSRKIQHWQETATPDQILAAWKSAVGAAGGLVASSAPAAQPAAPQGSPAAPPKGATPPPPGQPAVATPIQPAPSTGKVTEERTPLPAPAKGAAIALPPDETWPADLPALDSVASLQARLILVMNKLLAESGASKPGAGISAEPPATGASSPEARLIDLQRRVLSLQRRILAASGK